MYEHDFYHRPSWLKRQRIARKSTFPVTLLVSFYDALILLFVLALLAALFYFAGSNDAKRAEQFRMFFDAGTINQYQPQPWKN